MNSRGKITVTGEIDAETHALLAFVQEGIDAADRGDTVPHEEVMAELDAMIAKHRARCGP